MGRPCRVHYYIQVYELKEVYPKDYKNMTFEERRDYLQKWLDEKWNEKEESLKYFAENQEFVSEKNKENVVETRYKYKPSWDDWLFMIVPILFIYFVISMMTKTMLYIVLVALILFIIGLVYHATHQ